MKKGLTWFFSVIAVVLLVSSCSKSETYSDKLKNERKEIKKFLDANGFVVIGSYPTDKVFEKNEFYRDPETGVYINVVDSGNGNRAKSEDLPKVTYRFSKTYPLPASATDTVSNNDAAGTQPMSFTYGRSATYTYSANSNVLEYFYLSEGVTVPLKYVGENAVVRIIVPFSKGSTYQQNYSYKAVYYGYLNYTTIQNK